MAEIAKSKEAVLSSDEGALFLNPSEMQHKDFAMTPVQPECAG
jgi:hypothetical protein